MRTPSALVVALSIAAPMLLSPPAAEAHCDGVPGSNHCTVHDGLEDAVVRFNDAADGLVALVLVKDRQFHPEDVTIRNGGTVIWLWSDVDANRVHRPRSSLSCGSRQLDLDQCMPNAPSRWGECFDILTDTGSYLGNFAAHNVAYVMTFRYAPPTGPLEKSHGLLSGLLPLPPGPQPLPEAPAVCSQDSASFDGGVATVPYHCGIHNGINSPLRMRGTVTVEP